MADAWPGGCPAVPKLSGNAEGISDDVVRTPMDAGPDKMRRRYTNTRYPTNYQFIMTDAQLSTLITFYTSTLNNGTEVFEFTHPRTAGTENMRFLEPPNWLQIKDDLWRVFCNWELIP